jgi:protein TonB
MKGWCFILLFILSTPIFSQEDTTVYTYVDQEAEFPGGNVAMMGWIQRNLTYPSNIYEDAYFGSKLRVEFVVELDGSLTQITVHTKCEACKESLLTLLKTSPLWVPARNNGKIVRSLYHLPINICFE